MSGRVQLAGGAGSIAADFEQFPTLAGEWDRAAHLLTRSAEMAGLAVASQGSAAVLDPVGAAQVVGHSIIAGGSAAAAALGLTELALSLRAAAVGYAAAEQAAQSLIPMTDAMLDLPCLVTRLPVVLRGVVGGNLAITQQLLTADPDLVGVAVTGLGAVDALLTAGPAGLAHPVPVLLGALDGADARGLSAQLALLYPDTATSVLELPGWQEPIGLQGAPRTVHDLLDSLSAPNDVNYLEGGGLVAIRYIYAPDGARSVIVDLPGTTEWNLDPRTPATQINDLGTSLRSLADERTSYSAGVLTALRAAGVTASEPVMLVGHSQGGLVAAEVAQQAAASHEFTVTHLVTAGAPLGAAAVPAGVSVLALENRGDLVPHLEGRANPARANWITATVDRGGADVGSRHELDTYLQGAHDVDASRDPSLAAWAASAEPFLDGTSSASRLYQIRKA